MSLRTALPLAIALPLAGLACLLWAGCARKHLKTPELYATYCARCHGERGEGKPDSLTLYPRLDLLARFGPRILPVLDGLRFPTLAERVDALLARTTLTQLTRLLDRTRVHPEIRVLGRVEDVRPHVARGALFVIPLRIGGGTRIKAYEAMAMSLPVVASDVGGIPEIVDAGRTGLLVPPEDAAALAAAIATLDRDRALAGRMGAAGRARVVAEFSMEVMADRYERLYEWVSAVA